MNLFSLPETEQKHAIWLNIWHHYTVDGCPRHYRTQKSLEPLNDEIFTWDHLVPVSKNGVNLPINKRASCYRCNYEKGGKDMVNYIRFLEKIPRNERVEKALKNACLLLEYIILNGDKLTIS